MKQRYGKVKEVFVNLLASVNEPPMSELPSHTGLFKCGKYMWECVVYNSSEKMEVMETYLTW